MVRNEREWSSNFLNYMDYIVKHSNYKGLEEPFKGDETIRWVVSGNSDIGIKRATWWDNKKKELNLPDRASVAREIHPKELNGLKPCQICGKKLSIHYVYPNKNTLNKINQKFNSNFNSYDKTINEIYEILVKNNKEETLVFFRKYFKLAKDINDNKIIDFILSDRKSKLSPGVMSNAPDRFDGFHTYNACCRSKEDTGRHKTNLSRYGQDRRAYEFWSDGDWKKADRLMSEFRKHNVSADHIGPISLGFCHRPKFIPLSKQENSTKNNRMSLDDVKILIDDEKKGETVVSWHSKYIWDLLKNKVKNNKDAIKISSLMRKNHHYVLTLFSIIYKNDYKDFLLQFLNPQYSYYDYKIIGFNKLDGSYKEIKQISKTGKNQDNNVRRMIRIAFESLENYQTKENRKNKIWDNEEVNKLIKDLLNYLSENNTSKAIEILNIIFEKLAKELAKEWD